MRPEANLVLVEFGGEEIVSSEQFRSLLIGVSPSPASVGTHRL